MMKRSNTSNCNSRLIRVSRKNPCPVCKRPDWCSFTADGSLVLCMRVAKGSSKTATNKAYVHVLARTGLPTALMPLPPRKVTFRADPDLVDEVYRFLLGKCFRLHEHHAHHLYDDRGLSLPTVAGNNYASVPRPSEVARANQLIADRYGDMVRGVPGFFKEELTGTWMFRLFRFSGFFVPYRDIHGRIAGLQVRRDEGSPKYMWFSTPPADFNEGTASGSPVHLANPQYALESGKLIITEGALKADRISEFSGHACLAVAGVNGFSAELCANIREWFPDLSTLIVAFDMDWQLNLHVKRALFDAVRELEAQGFNVTIRTWDSSLGKGYDDYLFNQMEGRYE